MKALRIDSIDSVAIVAQDSPAGSILAYDGGSIKTIERITTGHKVALQDIATGDFVYKYGVAIGQAALAIPAGALVHEHNLLDITGTLCAGQNNQPCPAYTVHTASGTDRPLPTSIMAFPRDDGRVGIRNIILIVSTVTCANTLVNRVAWQSDCVPLTHDKGCVEGKASSKFTRLALERFAQNPNVFGVLVVGLGCEQIQAEALAASIGGGKQVEWLSIQQEGGMKNAEAKAMAMVRHMRHKAETITSSRSPMQGLVVGVQCGGSDWTTAIAGNSVIGAMTDLLVLGGATVLMSEVPGIPGAEHIVASRAVDASAGEAVLNMVCELRRDFEEKHGQPIEAINPTPGNKAGGITTLVEKSLGNIKKMGHVPVQGVLALGVAPPHAGLWIVDNRANGPDPVNLAGFAMAGANITVFSTGRGTPVGNPVMPVLKLTGNPETYAQLSDLMDFNAGVVLEGTSIPDAGWSLLQCLLRVAQGEVTRSEIHGNQEFAIPFEDSRSHTA